MLLFLFSHISCVDDPGLAILNGQDNRKKRDRNRFKFLFITGNVAKGCKNEEGGLAPFFSSSGRKGFRDKFSRYITNILAKYD